MADMMPCSKSRGAGWLTMTAAERLCLRQTESQPILEKLRSYLEKIQEEVLPKSHGLCRRGPGRQTATSSRIVPAGS